MSNEIAIIIYPNISEYDKFISCLKPSIDIIEFNPSNISKYKTIGFVWENSPKLNSIPWGNTLSNKYKWFSKEFIDFIELNPGLTIHLISCNLSQEDFVEEINQLQELYPSITIGFSFGEIGTEPGTWILDNIQTNIKSLYFTDQIDL
jgi:uncharacterized protein YlzI (FlbEa/FlbD family)